VEGRRQKRRERERDVVKQLSNQQLAISWKKEQDKE